MAVYGNYFIVTIYWWTNNIEVKRKKKKKEKEKEK